VHMVRDSSAGDASEWSSGHDIRLAEPDSIKSALAVRKHLVLDLRYWPPVSGPLAVAPDPGDSPASAGWSPTRQARDRFYRHQGIRGRRLDEPAGCHTVSDATRDCVTRNGMSALPDTSRGNYNLQRCPPCSLARPISSPLCAHVTQSSTASHCDPTANPCSASLHFLDVHACSHRVPLRLWGRALHSHRTDGEHRTWAGRSTQLSKVHRGSVEPCSHEPDMR